MPIRRGAISCSRYRVAGDVPKKDVRRWLTKALTARAFEPIDPKGEEDRAAGFVEIEDQRATTFAVGNVFDGDYALFAWRVEKIRIPSAIVRAELSEWSQKFEAKNGRAPGRREKGEQKELVRKMIRAKTEPSTKVFDVSFELKTNEVLVWGTSRGIVEEVQVALEEKLEVRLVPRVPASFVSPDTLDGLAPTPELFAIEPQVRS